MIGIKRSNTALWVLTKNIIVNSPKEPTSYASECEEAVALIRSFYKCWSVSLLHGEKNQ